MKIGVTFSRKVRAPQAYEMLEVGLYLEVDGNEKTVLETYEEARCQVNIWISEELNRLSVKSPEKQRIEPIA